jgi:hypothetical protein
MRSVLDNSAPRAASRAAALALTKALEAVPAGVRVCFENYWWAVPARYYELPPDLEAISEALTESADQTPEGLAEAVKASGVGMTHRFTLADGSTVDVRSGSSLPRGLPLYMIVFLMPDEASESIQFTSVSIGDWQNGIKRIKAAPASQNWGDMAKCMLVAKQLETHQAEIFRQAQAGIVTAVRMMELCTDTQRKLAMHRAVLTGHGVRVLLEPPRDFSDGTSVILGGFVFLLES